MTKNLILQNWYKLQSINILSATNILYQFNYQTNSIQQQKINRQDNCCHRLPTTTSLFVYKTGRYKKNNQDPARPYQNRAAYITGDHLTSYPAASPGLLLLHGFLKGEPNRARDRFPVFTVQLAGPGLLWETQSFLLFFFLPVNKMYNFQTFIMHLRFF